MWGNEPSHPNELPLWELESWWTIESSEKNCRGQNPLDWRVPYTIGNILEFRCLKWAPMTHLDTSNINYGQKKGQESNWQFDSRPLKVRNCPNFFVCRWHETNCLKALDEGYNFASNLFQLEVYTKLWAPKVAKVSTLGILGLALRSPHLGVPRQNDIWVLVPWPSTEYTIRRKVVASPKSMPSCESVFARGSFVH